MQENELSIRATATIGASPAQIWQILTDLRRYPEWHPRLELLHGVGPEGLEPGVVLRLRADRGRPTEREFDVTVTEVARPTALAWEGGDPEVFFGRHRFTLTPAPDGTHLVDEEVFSGALAAALLGEHRAALSGAYQAAANALKAVAERRPHAQGQPPQRPSA